MLDDTIGIKLPVGDVSAKACMLVKSTAGLPLAEIKQRAANNDFILLYDAVDLEGLEVINKLKRELGKLGVAARVFEDGREESPELLDNLEKLYREIADDPHID